MFQILTFFTIIFIFKFSSQFWCHGDWMILSSPSGAALNARPLKKTSLYSVSVHRRVRVAAVCLLVSLLLCWSGSHITSDRSCLHSLVSWTHSHAEGCRSCPDLQEVLEGQCRGALKLVWACVDGHSYVMDTRSNAETQCDDTAKANSEQQRTAWRSNSVHTARSGEAAAPQNHSGTPGEAPNTCS